MKSVWGVGALVFSLSLHAEPLNSEKVRSCVSQICGPYDTIMHALGERSFRTIFPADIRTTLDSQIRPMMSQILAHDERIFATNLESWKNANSQNLDKLPLFVKFLAHAYLWIQVRPALRSDGDLFYYDKQAFKELLGSISINDDDVENYNKVTNMVLNQSDKYAFLRGVPYDLLWPYLDMKPGEAPSFARKLLATINLYSDLLFKYQDDGVEVQVLKKAASAQPLQPFEKQMIKSIYLAALEAMHFSSGDFRDGLMKIPLSFKDLIPKLAPKVEQVRQFWTNERADRKIRDQLLRTCEERVTAYISAAPSDLAIKKFQELAEKAKSTALSILPKYFSGNDLVQARAALQRAKFTLPLSRNETMEVLKDYFKSKVVGSSMLTKALSSPKNRSLRDKSLFSSLIHLPGLSADDLEKNFYPTLNAACDSLKLADAVDFSLSPSSDVNVSWQSVLWPEYGIGTLAHELGHVASAGTEMSSGKGRHKFCDREVHSLFYGKFAPISRHSEEDFADTFSVSVLRALQAHWPFAKNFACMTLPFDRGKSQFNDWDLDLARESQSTHSTGIFRLLRIQAELGSVPPSCEGFWKIKKSCVK